MSTAIKVSRKFGDDGQRWVDDRGRELADVCRSHFATEERRDYLSSRFVFKDGSAITIHGDAWDLGYADCWCWDSTGHGVNCTRRQWALTDADTGRLIGAYFTEAEAREIGEAYPHSVVTPIPERS